ncbi:hypothetical protein SUS17_1722 [Sphingomonas sp. S17]|jgi:hypothetical protein|nr:MULTISPECIES: hypothetical protein [Sphingomonas]EGI55309.1 hypothetical protein SUS17_1722 [Sphingomonas sp. S17]MBQ1478714.1 hypothetical protein [Sphingomonas sp.]MCM3680728.1 hypothetical protein [Sphingomonas paucimobilis]NNG59897.1 hypothetical protein [Sphingomonas paucimobilis]QPS15824.1 hypothetical protein I6G65_16160 [Sphingomonas paucimobilis]
MDKHRTIALLLSAAPIAALNQDGGGDALWDTGIVVFAIGRTQAMSAVHPVG